MSGIENVFREQVHMKMYNILMELNRKMIFGEEITDAAKKEAVSVFLTGICGKQEASVNSGLSAKNEYIVCKSL